MNVWNGLTAKEKRQINNFNQFENRTKMAPEYSNGAKFEKIDPKSKLIFYKQIIDTLEPPNNKINGYIPMQIETTHKHDYIQHQVKPSQSVKNEKINQLIMDKYIIKKDDKLSLPRIASYNDPEYEWILIERNPIKPEILDLSENEKDKFDTTYSHDYKPIKRIYSGKPIRHDTFQLKLDNDSYDKETSYNKDFVEHKLPNYYFLPRDDQFNRRIKSSVRTNKRYFDPKELKLIKGYYNPYFNFDDTTPSKNLPNQNFKYETMKPVLERSKSYHFELNKLTPERVAINNQFQH